MMQQYQRWLWFQLRHCYAEFEVVCIFELMIQPSENYSGAENC